MKLRVRPWMMALLVVVAIFGTIGLASLAGVYVTSGGGGQGGGAVLPTGADPGDIKGSMTFGAISTGFGIPLEDLAAAFRLPAGGAAAFRCNGLESLGLAGDGALEIGVPSVRWFVALYKGVPYAPDATTGLTPEAAEVLRAKAPLDDATRALVAERTVGAG